MHPNSQQTTEHAATRSPTETAVNHWLGSCELIRVSKRVYMGDWTTCGRNRSTRQQWDCCPGLQGRCGDVTVKLGAARRGPALQPCCILRRSLYGHIFDDRLSKKTKKCIEIKTRFQPFTFPYPNIGELTHQINGFIEMLCVLFCFDLHFSDERRFQTSHLYRT